MDLDILFLGKFFPKEKEAEIKSKMKTGMQDAGNALQWNIINGLDANNCGTIRLLDYLPIDSYPKGYTDWHIEEYVFQHTEKYQSNDKIVACTNLSVVKQFLNYFPFRKEIKKWALDNGSRKKVLIMYTASTVFLQMAKYAKKVNKNILICCIIADLPEFLSARTLHGVHKLFNDYEVKRSNSLYKYIDRFVLLTDQMAQYLGITVPYVVMEGIAPDEHIEIDASIANCFAEKNYILYTGTLNYEFGIGVLLEAFSIIDDPDLSLVICGSGEAEHQIISSNDTRIQYLGKIDRKQALALQHNATVLVNPRQNNEEFTKYSFPSKTMEYLASGVPVVAYKLDGIPDEYGSYLSYVPDDTPETLASTIHEICCMSEEERSINGNCAKQFVLKNKNALIQSKKILDFICKNDF